MNESMLTSLGCSNDRSVVRVSLGLHLRELRGTGCYRGAELSLGAPYFVVHDISFVFFCFMVSADTN